MPNGARAMFAAADAAYLCYDCNLWEVTEPMTLCTYCQQLREQDRRRWFTRARKLVRLSGGLLPLNVALIIDSYVQAIH